MSCASPETPCSGAKSRTRRKRACLRIRSAAWRPSASIEAGWHRRPMRAPAEIPDSATVGSRKRSRPERTRGTVVLLRPRTIPRVAAQLAIIPRVTQFETSRHNLKRLHSLSGVVPVGVFLLEHFYTNSYAMFGPEVYNEKVRFLTSLPYVIAVEICGIGIPILFHAALGIAIGWSSRGNVARFGYFRNWMYLLQRVSGIFLLAFISFHVYKTRLSGASPDEMFQHMAGYLNPAQDPSNWLWVAFYALGVVAASFHLGNGLFTFGIAWGLLPGVRSQRWASRACIGLFVLL